MNIGLSVLGLLPGATRRGVENYTWNLIRALAAQETEHRYHLFVWQGYTGLDDLENERIVLHRIAFPRQVRSMQLAARVLAEQAIIPALVRRLRLDRLHFPDIVGAALFPLSQRCPMTLTIHDMMVYTHPASMGRFTRTYKAMAVPRSIARAAALVCDSRNTERELLEFFPAAQSKTGVVMLAAGDHFRPLAHAELDLLLEPITLQRQQYLLYLGPVEYRKNVDGLLRAYAAALEIGPLPPFVVAGKTAISADAILDLPKTLGIADKVTFLGYVDDATTVALCNGAQALLYPSHHEGFGLPILEAMACGTPVITSNRSSMPEVAGDAAILIDPDDLESLRDAIHLVSTQPALRDAMRAASLAQAARFSWARCAQEMIHFWESVAQ